MMYIVVATRKVEAKGGYEVTKQIPAFFIHSEVQGFNDMEGAVQVAREILGEDVHGLAIHPADYVL